MTVWKGRRWSTANAYLKPAMKKGKVRLFTRTLADRILFEGRRAVGRSRLAQGQIPRYYRSESSNSICRCDCKSGNFAAIRYWLCRYSSRVWHRGIANRKGVGENLQDHLEVYFQIACRKPITLYKHLNPVSKAFIAAQWLFFKSGLGASNQFETLGFIRSDKNIPYPDIQYHFLPVAIRYDGTAPAGLATASSSMLGQCGLNLGAM
jgi:choline dehydrogenase